MIKRDLKDGSQTKLEPEEPKSITQVVYFKNMSPDEKYNRISHELNKIKKLLPPKDLNDIQKHLTEVQKLKEKAYKMYEDERIKFVNAIAWLEKPRDQRPRSLAISEKDETENVNIEDVEAARKLIRALDNGVLENVNTVSKDETVDKKVDDEKVSEFPKSKLFETLNTKIRNLLETRYTFDQLWSLVEFWSWKVYDSLWESVKIWCVIFMASLFSIKILKNSKRIADAVNRVSNLLKKIFTVNIKIKGRATKITIEVFQERTQGGIKDFFLYLATKVKSYFE